MLKKEGDLSPFFYFLDHTGIVGKMLFLYYLSLTFAVSAYFINSIILLIVLYVSGWIWAYHLYVKHSKLVAAVNRLRKKKT